jgi:hypothetical protein
MLQLSDHKDQSKHRGIKFKSNSTSREEQTEKNKQRRTNRRGQAGEGKGRRSQGD